MRVLRGAPIAAVAGLLAWPCAAQTWNDFLVGLGPAETPPAVIAYLKESPLVRAAPKPLFSHIRTETVDGTVAQSFKLAGYDGAFGRIEGVREERAKGTRRSGAQTVSMVTALSGLVLVSLQNETTGAGVFLRKIELGGELLPPSTARKASMRYERVQRSRDVVVEEIRDCTLSWTEPDAEQPVLTSRCTGSTRITQPTSEGNTVAETSPDNSTSTLVYRPDLGWIFDQRTKVLDFTP
jgi:hypothetical protein